MEPGLLVAKVTRHVCAGAYVPPSKFISSAPMLQLENGGRWLLPGLGRTAQGATELKTGLTTDLKQDARKLKTNSSEIKQS